MSDADGCTTGSPHGASPPPPVALQESDLAAMSSVEVWEQWKQREALLVALQEQLAQQAGHEEELRQAQEKTRTQLSEAQMRERVLMRRLAAKEQETQDLALQVNELKNAQIPTATSLRNALIDPAVNSLIQLLRKELQQTRAQLEDTQNELAAWKFTPDSNTGKRLMAKCRLLYQENEELGKMTSSGRIALLEGELELQKKFSEEVRQSQQELDAFLADLDEDVEGMQSTILFLQQELRRERECVQGLQNDVATLKLQQQPQQQQQQQQQANGRAYGANANESARATDCDSDVDDDAQAQQQQRTRSVKRVRRSSVLSIDYNEEDTLVISSANGDVAMSSDAE